MRKGEIYYADLSPVVGSEQGGVRPVLIVQNDVGNQHSPTTIVAPMTTRDKMPMTTHVPVKLGDVDNVILLEQVRAISRVRLISRFGEISKEDLARVDNAMRASLGIEPEEDPAPIPRPVIPPNRQRRRRTDI